MLRTHASILSEVRVDPFTSDDTDVGMPCIEIVDSEDDIDVIG